MSFKKLKEFYGEGKEEHFDEQELIQHLERTGQKHEANQVRRIMKREEEKDEN